MLIKTFPDRSKKQDDIVLAVRAGIVDAGFVRTGQLESMEKEGKIKMDDFVIVDQKKDSDFPFIRSTAMYPEWFLCVIKGRFKTNSQNKNSIAKDNTGNKGVKSAALTGLLNRFQQRV